MIGGETLTLEKEDNTLILASEISRFSKKTYGRIQELALISDFGLSAPENAWLCKLFGNRRLYFSVQ